jgi:thiamine-phosphate pyrophosphorylase
MDPSGRRERLARAHLYVVTDARTEQGDLREFLDAILEAGTDIVQLRKKEAEAGDLLRWSETFREAADHHGALFLMNDRPDVALAAGADGVHVGQDDLPVEFVRELIGPDLLIGLSTHDEEQLRSSAIDADYLCVGPVHETPTKPGRPATGVHLVEVAAASEPKPWFAIGGIDRHTLPEVVAAGARRIVVVRAVTVAADPPGAVRALLDGLAVGSTER